MSERSFTRAMGRDEDPSPRATMEAPFGHALAELGRSCKKIVGLTADLGKYTDIHPFRDEFPHRFFNVGMAEQNLIAVAAGLARTGYRPFVTTYGVFASRRAYDFIAIACAHSNLPVTIVAALPGLTTGYGGTHQAIEDLALMSMIPGLVVLDPADATEIVLATRAAAAHGGPVYMRLLRGNVPVVFDAASHRFEIGKAMQLREGRDVGFVATGLMTERALDAAARLEQRGISAGVLHVPTIKPFDGEAAAVFASSVARVVTAENHVVRGGLGTLTAEALFDHGVRVPLARVGLPDRFLPCGAVASLQKRFGITVEHLVAAAGGG
jgi:transketolase